MKSFLRILGQIFIVILLIMAVLVILCVASLLFLPHAHSAEPQSAVIEFTSAEDLIAQKDSVMAVVDTVIRPITDIMYSYDDNDLHKIFRTTGIEGVIGVDGLEGIDTLSVEFSGSYRYRIRYHDTKITIRHRRLVCVTVTEEPREDGVWGAVFIGTEKTEEEAAKIRASFPPPGSPFIRSGTAVVFFDWIEK